MKALNIGNMLEKIPKVFKYRFRLHPNTDRVK